MLLKKFPIFLSQVQKVSENRGIKGHKIWVIIKQIIQNLTFKLKHIFNIFIFWD